MSIGERNDSGEGATSTLDGSGDNANKGEKKRYSRHDALNAAIPLAASVLGYAGALPFILATSIIWFDAGGLRETMLLSIITFGAVILTFMGGVRWGLSMRSPNGPNFLQLTVSIIPAAISWLTLMLANRIPDYPYLQHAQLTILIISFALLLWSDILAARRGEPPRWYPGLRVPLTIIVEACLCVSLYIVWSS